MAKTITAYKDRYGKIHESKLSADLCDNKFELEQILTSYNFTQGQIDTLLRALSPQMIQLQKKILDLKVKISVEMTIEPSKKMTTNPVIKAKQTIDNIDNY